MVESGDSELIGGVVGERVWWFIYQGLADVSGFRVQGVQG